MEIDGAISRDNMGRLGSSFWNWCTSHPKSVALILYALIALLANFPVYPGDPHHLNTYTSYDIAQTTWFLAYTPYALLHGQNLFFTNVVNYPVGVNLAQNTGMPLLGLITAPLTLLVSPIASLNLLRWLAFALSAFSAFWVFARLVKWTPAAFIGGLLYGFSPYMIAQGSLHLNLTFVPLPPLIFYALYEICVQQRGRARRWGLVLGVLVVAQYLISAEILATTAIVAAIAAFYLFFLCIRDVPSRVPYIAKSAVYAFLVIVPLLAYPVWYLMHGAARYTGPAQGYINVFNADLLGPIVPTIAQLVAPHHLAAIGSSYVAGQGDLSENGTYLGIPLLLVTLYFIGRYWRRLWPIYLALVAATMFLFSLGPQLIVDGKAKHLLFNLPFRKLNHLPLLENLLPVRFSLYVVFFITLIVVLGINWIREDRVAAGIHTLWIPTANGGGLLTQSVAWFVGLLTLVSLLPTFPYKSYNVRINWSESKKGLAIIPTNARVLTYPYSTVYSDTPMLWQAVDGIRFKIFGSYALVPSKAGTASLLPTVLGPYPVEAMLENSVTPSPAFGVPDDTATALTVLATSITLAPKSLHFKRSATSKTLRVTIDSINTRNGTLVVWVKRLDPILVQTSQSTNYVIHKVRHPGLRELRPLENVVITGVTTTGTVNPTTAAQLRQFIVTNRVQDVVIDLGIRDSGEIARWFREAIGPPTRAGAGGEIWLNANTKARAFSAIGN